MIDKTVLYVPFSEKDHAKALGARWNPEKKYWYTLDPDPAPLFSRWMGPSAQSRRDKIESDAYLEPRVTPRSDFSLPESSCRCAPWETCEHIGKSAVTQNEPAIEGFGAW